MNQTVFTGSFVSLRAGLDVKQMLCDTVVEAISQEEGSFRSGLEGLLAHLRAGVDRFPVVSEVSHQGLKVGASILAYSDEGKSSMNCVLRVVMPCGESELLWMPWLPDQVQPERHPGDYHPIRIAGRPVLQARATRCYDHAYPYSGQTHPLEPETPEAIRSLYRLTNAMFGLPQDGKRGVNMCLENDYGNGRLYISEHSDDERSFGLVHDVFCYITGPASREGVFRVSKRRKHCVVLHNAMMTRDLFRIRIPAGLYVMRGRAFQQRYTHEFPQLHEGLFKRICSRAAKVFPGFPSKVDDRPDGCSQKGLVQAAWLKEHREDVLRQIDGGAFKTSKRHRLQTTPAQDRASFEEWCLHRTSYTLRNFQVSEDGVSDRPKKRVRLDGE